MAFTLITVTGLFTRSDGTPASGTVTAQLSEDIANGTTTLETAPIVGKLDATGHLVNQAGAAFTLEANDDAGTSPAGSRYWFTVQLDNGISRSFPAVIPHAAPGGTIDITSLQPVP